MYNGQQFHQLQDLYDSYELTRPLITYCNIDSTLRALIGQKPIFYQSIKHRKSVFYYFFATLYRHTNLLYWLVPTGLFRVNVTLQELKTQKAKRMTM